MKDIFEEENDLGAVSAAAVDAACPLVPVSIEVRQYERRETVEAFRFTEAVAAAVLLDKAELPWGLWCGGNWHPERREVYSAYIYVKSADYGKQSARWGDWVCRIAGQLIVIDHESFNARYRPAGCAPVVNERSESSATLPSEAL